MRYSALGLLLGAGLLAGCHDKSRDVPCLVPLPKTGLAPRAPLPVLLNGIRVGKLTGATPRPDSLLAAVLELDEGVRVPKSAVFRLHLASLLGLGGSAPYTIQVKTSSPPHPPYLTPHDTVRVLPYVAPSAEALFDTTSVRLLDSLVRHVGRQLRRHQQEQ